MSKAISKEKVKRGERRSRAAVEFVVPLQLEECAYRLNHQSDETPLRAKAKRRKDGIMHFTAVLYHNNIVKARCEGELHRWEGTATQVRGQITMRIPWGLKADFGCIVLLIWLLMDLIFVVNNQQKTFTEPIQGIGIMCILILPYFGLSGLYKLGRAGLLQLYRSTNRRRVFIYLENILTRVETN